jgi:hypothetical protein
MKNLARSLPLTFALLLPLTASADVVAGVNSNGGWFLGFGSGGGFGSIGLGCGLNTICVVAAQFIFIINYVLVPLIFAAAFLVFLWGVFRAYIFKHGEEEVTNGHQLILWGIVGFVVMISLWGIVNVVSNTFGLYGIGAPIPPTSYPTQIIPAAGIVL